MPYYFIPIIILFLVLFIIWKRNKVIVARKAIEKRKAEDKTEMIELAKKFIDKECIVYSFDCGHQFEGVIKEVADGAILIENNGRSEAINLDFVIRIREYPRNKKGKKKSIVLD